MRDNGVGFDPQEPRLARHGLIGMRYRVEADGGTMRLESSPGSGHADRGDIAAARAAAARRQTALTIAPATAEA